MSDSANTLAKTRISTLLDDNSFVEVGALVTARSTDFNTNEQKSPNDGVITGYGTINDQLVYVYSQDKAVMNGTMGEMHSKKIERIYSLAQKVGAPVIEMIDCAGIRLQEATDALNALGSVYSTKIRAKGIVPQISLVFGSCQGGLDVLTSLSDFVLMEENASMSINVPNTLDNNNSEKCDNACAKFQEENTGIVDYSGTSDEIIEAARQLFLLLPSNNQEIPFSMDDTSDDLNRSVEGIEGFKGNVQASLAMLSDDGYVLEMKKSYGKDIVTAFIKLNDAVVGVVANNDVVLSANGCNKAAEFIDKCDTYNIPILTLVDVERFATTMCDEKRLAKAGAKLSQAFANATVSKVCVIIGKAYGTPYVIMNSKAIGADFVYAWKNSSISMMEATQAVKIMYADEIAKADDKVSFIDEKANEYNALQSNINSAAARGYVDTIIDPADTRKYVIGAFEMLFPQR